MVKIYVYFKNGNVYTYEVDSAEKAREHADKICSETLIGATLCYQLAVLLNLIK